MDELGKRIEEIARSIRTLEKGLDPRGSNEVLDWQRSTRTDSEARKKAGEDRREISKDDVCHMPYNYNYINKNNVRRHSVHYSNGPKIKKLFEDHWFVILCIICGLIIGMDIMNAILNNFKI